MRVTFNSPLIKNMSGKVSKDSDLYYMTRNGKTYLCCRTKTKTKTSEEAKRLNGREGNQARKQQERFRQMVVMVNEIMATTMLKKFYEERYKKQKKYSTLRGYIFHCCAEENGR